MTTPLTTAAIPTPLEQYKSWQELVYAIKEEVRLEKIQLKPLNFEVKLEASLDAFSRRQCLAARMTMNGKPLSAEDSFDSRGLVPEEAAASITDLLLSQIYDEVRLQVYAAMLRMLDTSGMRLSL